VRDGAGGFHLQRDEITRLLNRWGVYFPYQGGWILVYIGKALSLRARVPQHDLNEEFMYIGYEPCHWSRARELERKLLDSYEREHGQLPCYSKIH